MTLIFEMIVKGDDKLKHYCRATKIPLRIALSACEQFIILVEKDGRRNYLNLIEKDNVEHLITCPVCLRKFKKFRAAKFENITPDNLKLKE